MLAWFKEWVTVFKIMPDVLVAMLKHHIEYLETHPEDRYWQGYADGVKDERKNK